MDTSTNYVPAATRYDNDSFFRRCGRSGLRLGAISLGTWHNFGDEAQDENCKAICRTAFDLGITHFDLANNYGPPPGSAERRVGKIIKDLPRDELIISTKAGFYMWPGPYGDHGSRKHLLASLDQSLLRLELDYVDIYYHHRPDADTPLEETLGALDGAVRSGKALYAGISSYNGQQTGDAVRVVKYHGLTRPVIHQPYYNMFDRRIEQDLLPVTAEAGIGVIAFCPLAQGLLTDKYLNGIPSDSRAAAKHSALRQQDVTDQARARAGRLNEHAGQRGQSLAQMALAWVLRDSRVTSALTGASRPEQVKENVAALANAHFDESELKLIDEILSS